MTTFDTNAPNGFFQRWKARLPLLALSTALLALVISGAIYELRPKVEARAIVNISDGELSTIIPEIAPDFTYSAPTADKVASWLEKDILGADQSVKAEGRQLIITARNKTPSDAFNLARQTADDSIAYLADHRPDLLRDVKAWFDTQFEQLEPGKPTAENSREQHLFNLFEDALVDAKTEAQAQYAFLKSQALPIDVALINGDGGNDRPRRGTAFGRIAPRDQVLLASKTYRNLSDELDHFQTQSPPPPAEVIAFQARQSAILENKATLIANDAWVQPVAWLNGPVMVEEQPFWATLSFFVPASLALALVTLLILTWLYDVLRKQSRRGLIEEKPGRNAEHEQVFGDPHWPAPTPQRSSTYVEVSQS